MNNIYILKFIFLLIPLYINAQEEVIININLNRNTLNFEHDFYLNSYQKNELIFHEDVEYYPYTLEYENDYCSQFKQNKIDSIELVFTAQGIHNNIYEYKIPMDSTNHIFCNDEIRYFYSLHITDMYINNRNIKIIDEIKFPYLYIYDKKTSGYSKVICNYNCAQKPKIKDKSILDRSQYKYFRDVFWKEYLKGEIKWKEIKEY